MTRYLLVVWLLTSSVQQAAVAAPARSSASSSWTDGKASAAGLLGWGIGFDSPNAYGFGFGGRGGYSFSNLLPLPFYAGGSFIYYIGSSQNFGVFGSARTHVWAIMAEFGPEFLVGPVELRPFLGLGIGILAGGAGPFSSSTAYFGLTPGAVATYSFNGPYSTGPFVGVDAHLTWLPSPGFAQANDLSLLATGGYRF